MKYFHTFIITITLLVLAGCGGSKQTGLPATRKAPTFATAAANDYVKNLSQTANDYVDAIKAKDVRKIKVLTPKLTEIMRTRQTVVNGLKPDEAAKVAANSAGSLTGVTVVYNYVSYYGKSSEDRMSLYGAQGSTKGALARYKAVVEERESVVESGKLLCKWGSS